MADKPDINSLDRFRKQPTRLVLETYDHCEVPAGCGGVVFRWRRAECDREVAFTYFGQGGPTVWVDGEEMIARRADLRAGPHLLALRLDNAPLSGVLFMMVGAVRSQRMMHWPVVFRTLADGGWFYRLTEPGEGWQTGAGDGWSPLVGVAYPPEPERNQPGRWSYRRCVDEGAACLGVPDGPGGVGTVWVRTSIELPPKEA
jgi:hypothetical protein